MMESIEGKRGLVRSKPPLPAIKGLFNKPTLINNVITLASLSAILMQGKDDHNKTRERWQIIKEFFQEKEIDYKEIFSVDGSILSKLVCLIYTLDMTSIYNAVIGKIDPSPVNSIDFIKNKL